MNLQSSQPLAQQHYPPAGAMSYDQSSTFKAITLNMQSQTRSLAQNSVPINVAQTAMSTGLKANPSQRTLQAQSSIGSSVQPTTKSVIFHKKLDRSFSEPAERKCVATVSSQSNSVSTRYKTELCRSFVESGACKYGEKCQFAHGNDELRAITRHPKFKTENCRRFHTVGICPYGPRCHFIHNGDEDQRKYVNSLRYANSVSPSNCSSSNGSNSASNSLSLSINSSFSSNPVLVRQNGSSFFSDQSSPGSPNSATAFCPVSNFNNVEPLDSVLVRPKALSFGSTSLGSSGEISTASSSSQSPTSLGSFFPEFESMFNVSSIQNAFNTSSDSFGKYSSWTTGFGGSQRSLKPDEANSDIPDSLLFNLISPTAQDFLSQDKSFFDHYPSVPVSPSADSVNSELEALKISSNNGNSAGCSGSNTSESSGYSPVSAFSPADISGTSSNSSAFNRYDSFFSTPPTATVCSQRARLPTFAKFSNNIQQ